MGKKQRLGEILIDKGLVTPQSIQEALRIQVGGNRRIGLILTKMGLINDLQLLEALSDQLAVPIVNIRDEFSNEVRKILPKYLCKKYSVVPLSVEENNILNIAMMDPLDDQAISDIENYTGMVAKPVLAKQKDITNAINGLIPYSVKDVFNPQVYSNVAKIFTALALILLITVVSFIYSYMQKEMHGTASTVAGSKIYKNHDMMISVEEEGKISLLGHGAYSNGHYSVTFNNSEALSNFLEKQRKNFSDKQYNWLQWVMDKKLK
jgi:hypothetical protein